MKMDLKFFFLALQSPSLFHKKILAPSLPTSNLQLETWVCYFKVTFHLKNKLPKSFNNVLSFEKLRTQVVAFSTWSREGHSCFCTCLQIVQNTASKAVHGITPSYIAELLLPLGSPGRALLAALRSWFQDTRTRDPAALELPAWSSETYSISDTIQT